MNGCLHKFELRRLAKWTFCVLFWAIISICPDAGRVWAQLSPGELSSAHAHLEGLRKCSSCHKLGDRDVVPKCLECHRLLATRRSAGQGLHARDDYADCAVCHVEHRGRDIDLVFWPDGLDAFDHAGTGHVLEGRHRHVACRDCHRVEHVSDPDPLIAAGKDLGRTYLGLSRECFGCHSDVHRGQLPGVCTACHGQEAWKPAPGFSHDATSFPLAGLHRDVTCAKCHEALDPAQPSPDAVVFAGLAHASCVDCHKDPHAGRLGPRCTDCHTPDGWRAGLPADFDHDRTRYPLNGRHATLRCEACHGQERVRPAFAACIDCHDDVHGAAAARPRLARCEDCHDIEGFRPARYAIDRHGTSAFPLAGGHLATPCGACHRPAGAPERPFALILDHGACIDCHDDPHGPLSRPEFRACTGCHDIGSWRPGVFDHAALGYPLTGAHARAACAACHPTATDGRAPATAPIFTTTSTACADCHADVHLGQFAVAGESAVHCDHCHVPADWFAERFDHDRDSRFPLRGGHEGVACERCHDPLEGPGARSLTFKPLETACTACHRANPTPAGDDR